jgi:hypothetical protein
LKEDSQITIRDSSQADKLFRQILATCLICLRPGRRRGESANLT